MKVNFIEATPRSIGVRNEIEGWMFDPLLPPSLLSTTMNLEVLIAPNRMMPWQNGYYNTDTELLVVNDRSQDPIQRTMLHEMAHRFYEMWIRNTQLEVVWQSYYWEGLEDGKNLPYILEIFPEFIQEDGEDEVFAVLVEYLYGPVGNWEGDYIKVALQWANGAGFVVDLLNANGMEV